MASHAEPYIYADNAATTPLSPRALEAMMPHLTSEFGNPSGIHRIARSAAEALAGARGTMARLLNASRPEEIYFTSGGTESDNWVLRGAVQRFRDMYGPDATPRIITSAIEHHAVLHCCQALEREGAEVTYLPVDEYGFVNPEDLQKALAANEQAMRSECGATTRERGVATRPSNAPQMAECKQAQAQQNASTRTAARAPGTALVSIMLANNEVGTIEPIRELAAIAHKRGVPFHTDAVQAVGHIPVDVSELGVDALSLSAHKFHGPRGVGALYLREGFSIPPFIAGGAQERGERAGTENLAGVVGMATALGEALATLGSDAKRVSSLRDELVDHVLSEVDGVHLTGAPPCGNAAPGKPTSKQGDTPGLPARLPSIASFTCDHVDGELLMVLLDRAGVAAATGSACATGSIEPSHVLTAMGVDPARAKGALRLSLASSITPEELDLLKQRVPAAIKRARLMSASV